MASTINSQGRTSCPSSLTIVGSPIGVRGVPVTIDMATDRQWNVLLLLSTSNQPSVLPGIVSLGIANNFTALFDLGYTQANTAGQGQASVTFPTSIATGQYYFQAIAFDANQLTVPLETSNVYTINLVF